VLITDEVLAVGDESFQKKCIRWLEQFRSDGGTLLLVSHSMYHIQSLCPRAMWLDHGRLRLAGNSFDVTREYLTYHEEKTRIAHERSPHVTGGVPRVERIWLERGDGMPAGKFAQGEEIVLQGIVTEPDDRQPALLFGVVRADGTPVYGTHSAEAGYLATRLDRGRFSFGVRLPRVAMLPGKYAMRAHVLDPEGLRLFDSTEIEFVVTGETRDYGLVRIEHEWIPGRGAPAGAADSAADGD
jgi:lipopolysaccharide transport system ATP-binding protein